MKCEECLILVEEYFDDKLNGQCSEQVFAHISNCKECRHDYEYLQQEQEIFASYLINVEPSPTLTRAEFEAKIKAEKVTQAALNPNGLRTRIILSFQALRFNYFLAGAAAVLLIGICTGLLIHLRFNEGGFETKSTSVIDTSNIGQMSVEMSNPIKLEKPTEYPQQTDSSNSVSINSKSTSFKSSKEKLISSVRQQISMQGEQKTILRDRPLQSKTKHFYEEDLGEDARLNVAVRPVPIQIDNLARETSKQVERVQLLLRSFRNAPLTEDELAFDVAYEKQLAGKLLHNNVLLRRNAESLGNFDIEEVLSRLEPYLLDIANLQDNALPDDVAAIKNRMRKQEIVAALQIYQPTGF